MLRLPKILYLQHIYEANCNFIRWTIGQAFNLEDFIIMLNGPRYQCHFRAAFLCQCEHEVAQDEKLKLCKYDHIWLNGHQHNLANFGRNEDVINTSVAVLYDDTPFSFEATTNNDQPYQKPRN